MKNAMQTKATDLLSNVSFVLSMDDSLSRRDLADILRKVDEARDILIMLTFKAEKAETQSLPDIEGVPF